MSSIIVCDSCSLIKLLKGGVLDSLGSIYETVYIPKAVEMEFTKETRKKVVVLPFLEIVAVSSVLPLSMGDGEREAISLCKEMNIRDIMTDDKRAINHSIRYGLTPITTLDFLIIAKYSQVVDTVKPILDMIIQNGDGIDDRTYEETLEKAGE